MRRNIDQKHSIVEIAHTYDVIFDTREVFIHGEVDGDCFDSGVDFRMANKFVKNIQLLDKESKDPIIVHQHTDGGDWFSGMMIYDAIKSCTSYIILIMHGIAASMGSIIPQAADVRIIMPNCMFMIHNGSGSIDGTYKKIQSYADLDKKIQGVMVDIYSQMITNGQFFVDNGYDIKKIKKFILQKMDQKEDWWMSSEETVFYGFADAVLGTKGYETIEQIRNNITRWTKT